jgi:hypothetical protein
MLKVALGHSPAQMGPGVMQLSCTLFRVSGPLDSKPVSCTSYIYCHCNDSGTLMSLNVSSFSSFTEFSAEPEVPRPRAR